MEPQRLNTLVDLPSLIELFYKDAEDLGQFTEIESKSMPPVPRKLLAHEMHMTVAVEEFHRSRVDVIVLRSRQDETMYAREILLSRQSDGVVVQYGIVRLELGLLPPDIVAEIQTESKPLGRILIERNVFREVRLERLYKITPNQPLQQLLEQTEVADVYGRTAMIYCNSVPAISLLEIVN